VSNLYGEAFTVIPVGARYRRQVLHGRVRSDFPKPYELLDGLGQLAHQSQTARNPRHAPVKPPRKIFQAETEAAMQLGQQPALFERRFSFRRALGPVQDQGCGFVHVPNRGAHRIVPEALQSPDPLVTVDDQEPVWLFRQANDDNGHLLPSVGQGRQQPPLALRTSHPKPFVAQIELMELKIHVISPPCRCPCSNDS